MNGHFVLSHVELVHDHRKDPRNNNQPMEESPVKDNLSKMRFAKSKTALVCNE